jgi:predicted transcriptional regulator
MDVKKTRLKLRISQAHLAKLSDVSRFKICLHERGDQPLNEADLARIRYALQREAQRLADALAPIAFDSAANGPSTAA